MHFDNYVTALFKMDFAKYFMNSIIASLGATSAVLIFDSLAGYAFAMHQFRGKNIFFMMILITSMIPFQVIIIPLFLMFRGIPLFGGNDILGHGGMGLLNTYACLIIPFVATTFGTYLMREYYKMMPKELQDAGRIDGCSELGIYLKIYLPLAVPALVTVGMLWFTESWNSYLWPLITTSTKDMRTIQLGMSVFKGQYDVKWNLLMAGVVISTVPVFLMFIIGQKRFIEGIALSGLKG
jgi:multiple sugar transport system permease protein